jgi:UDP-N-acetyl-D-glucosamine dehydrogenase
MKLLREKGGEIAYHDPHVSDLAFENQLLHSSPLNSQSLSSSDVVVVVTDHSGFNAKEIVDYSRLIIDTRNLTRGIHSEKIVRL